MLDYGLCVAYNYSMSLPNCMDCNKRLKDYRSKRCRSCAKQGNKNPQFGVYGEDNAVWKGGYINKHLGYRVVHHKGKRIYEHRLIMEKHLGRELKQKEVVHHINHDKTDNRIENLKLMTQAEHVDIHKPMLGKKSKVRRDPLTQRFTDGS